jgi:hypothetical protein
VVENKKLIESDDFKNISMTGEKWLPIIEVS